MNNKYNDVLPQAKNAFTFFTLLYKVKGFGNTRTGRIVTPANGILL